MGDGRGKDGDADVGKDGDKRKEGPKQTGMRGWLTGSAPAGAAAADDGLPLTKGGGIDKKVYADVLAPTVKRWRQGDNALLLTPWPQPPRPLSGTALWRAHRDGAAAIRDHFWGDLKSLKLLWSGLKLDVFPQALACQAIAHILKPRVPMTWPATKGSNTSAPKPAQKPTHASGEPSSPALERSRQDIEKVEAENACRKPCNWGKWTMAVKRYTAFHEPWGAQGSLNYHNNLQEDDDCHKLFKALKANEPFLLKEFQDHFASGSRLLPAKFAKCVPATVVGYGHCA